MNKYIKLKSVLKILDNVMSDDSIKHKGKAIRKRLNELPTVDVKRLRKLLDEEEKKNAILAKQFYKAGAKDLAERLKEEVKDTRFAYEAEEQCECIDNILKELAGEG